MARRMRSFAEARAYVHTLRLDSPAQWRAWVRSAQRPRDIAVHPEELYRHRGWAGWQDWLGTDRRISSGRAFRPFDEARAFARTLGLQTTRAWRAWASSPACPPDMPRQPQTFYRTEWVSMGDWQGTGRPGRQRPYRSFAEARRVAQGLRLRGAVAWFRWSKSGERPADIPTHPERTYADAGWAGWGDFLGTGHTAPHRRRFRPFAEARAYVHTLGLETQGTWKMWCRSGARPADIPAAPDLTYRDAGWTHWGDWLGSGHPPRRKRRL